MKTQIVNDKYRIFLINEVPENLHLIREVEYLGDIPLVASGYTKKITPKNMKQFGITSHQFKKVIPNYKRIYIIINVFI